MTLTLRKIIILVFILIIISVFPPPGQEDFASLTQKFSKEAVYVIEKFTVVEADLFTFYKIPKELFTNPKYESVSTEGKVLYGVLLDRNSLSIKNDWIDEQGYVYIFFSREEAMELLKISSATVVKLFKELKNVDLIEEVRQGLNKPNIIYVGKFITSNADITTDFQNLKVRTFKNQKSEL